MFFIFRYPPSSVERIYNGTSVYELHRKFSVYETPPNEIIYPDFLIPLELERYESMDEATIILKPLRKFSSSLAICGIELLKQK